MKCVWTEEEWLRIEPQCERLCVCFWFTICFISTRVRHFLWLWVQSSSCLCILIMLKMSLIKSEHICWVMTCKKGFLWATEHDSTGTGIVGNIDVMSGKTSCQCVTEEAHSAAPWRASRCSSAIRPSVHQQQLQALEPQRAARYWAVRLNDPPGGGQSLQAPFLHNTGPRERDCADLSSCNLRKQNTAVQWW